MKKLWLLAVLVPVVAVAGYIKVWGPGDTFMSQDINGNFAHIHSLMVGGHGARLVNADVSPSAGIAHSKLASPGLIPRLTGTMLSVCTVASCNWTTRTGFAAAFGRTGTGQYSLAFATARPNNVYSPVATSIGDGIVAPSRDRCAVYGTTFLTTGFSIMCTRRVFDGGVDEAVDVPFTVTVMDDDS